jgi:diguanylate cyclase
MDKLAVGGLRFLARTSVALVAGLVLTALAIGVEVRLGPSLLTTAACLPFLVVYPIAIAYVTDQLTRRVRQQNRQLEALNRIDRLSQLSNRSHWEETVMIEYQRYKRSGRTASLLMIDIDHFKAVNDRFGHGVGDDVIRSMGLLLRRSLRKADLAGRYGGEEFGVLLPDTAEQGALAIAERLREAIASATMSEAEAVRCTVSIGVSTLTRDTLGHLQWMDEADRALYAAKAAGRDRVQFSRTIAA